MPYLNFDDKTDKVKFSKLRENETNTTIMEDKIIITVVNYFLNTFDYPDVSGIILRAFNYWIQAPKDKLEKHHEHFKTATVGYLLDQDVCENRKLRQGKPTAHVIYDIALTLSSTMATELSLITWVEDKYIQRNLQLIYEHKKRLSRIRSLRTELENRVVCPDEELYYQLCGSRGILLIFLSEIEILYELYGIQKVNFKKLTNNIRTFLTIVDECRRVAVNNTDDIEAGHFSFPVVYAVNERGNEGDVILSIMRQRTKDKLVLGHAVAILKHLNCFEYAKQKLQILREEIFEEYKKLDKNPLMEEFFDNYLQIPNSFENITWELS